MEVVECRNNWQRRRVLSRRCFEKVDGVSLVFLADGERFRKGWRLETVNGEAVSAANFCVDSDGYWDIPQSATPCVVVVDVRGGAEANAHCAVYGRLESPDGWTILRGFDHALFAEQKLEGTAALSTEERVAQCLVSHGCYQKELLAKWLRSGAYNLHLDWARDDDAKLVARFPIEDLRRSLASVGVA